MHEVNWLAVLVAGIVPMIVGFLWYGPLFSKRWLELMETTAEEIQKNFNPLKTHGASFVLALVTAFILAQLFAGMGGPESVSSMTGAGGNAMVGLPLGADGPHRFRSPGFLSGMGLRGPQGGTLLAQPGLQRGVPDWAGGGHRRLELKAKGGCRRKTCPTILAPSNQAFTARFLKPPSLIALSKRA